MKTITLFLVFTLLAACTSVDQEHKPDDPFSVGKAFYLDRQYEEAVGPLLIAARDGNGEASYLLGEMHELALGVKHSEALATIHYLAGAQLGHGDAQYKIASRYEAGTYVPRDKTEALKWYLLASDNATSNPKFRGVSAMHISLFLQTNVANCPACIDQLREAEARAAAWKASRVSAQKG